MRRISKVWQWAVLACFIAALPITVSWWYRQPNAYPSCVLHASGELECPFCGSSRSIVAFSDANYTEAFLTQPFVSVGLAVLFVYALMRLFVLKLDHPTGRSKTIMRKVVVVYMLCWLVYTVIRNAV
jgi:hypothetical protein